MDEFIFSRVEDGNTVLSVDVSGSGDSNNAVDVVVLEAIDSFDVDTMVNSGNMNVV